MTKQQGNRLNEWRKFPVSFDVNTLSSWYQARRMLVLQPVYVIKVVLEQTAYLRGDLLLALH